MFTMIYTRQIFSDLKSSKTQLGNEFQAVFAFIIQYSMVSLKYVNNMLRQFLFRDKMMSINGILSD